MPVFGRVTTSITAQMVSMLAGDNPSDHDVLRALAKYGVTGNGKENRDWEVIGPWDGIRKMHDALVKKQSIIDNKGTKQTSNDTASPAVTVEAKPAAADVTPGSDVTTPQPVKRGRGRPRKYPPGSQVQTPKPGNPKPAETESTLKTANAKVNELAAKSKILSQVTDQAAGSPRRSGRQMKRKFTGDEWVTDFSKKSKQDEESPDEDEEIVVTKVTTGRRGRKPKNASQLPDTPSGKQGEDKQESGESAKGASDVVEPVATEEKPKDKGDDKTVTDSEASPEKAAASEKPKIRALLSEGPDAKIERLLKSDVGSPDGVTVSESKESGSDVIRPLDGVNIKESQRSSAEGKDEDSSNKMESYADAKYSKSDDKHHDTTSDKTQEHGSEEEQGSKGQTESEAKGEDNSQVAAGDTESTETVSGNGEAVMVEVAVINSEKDIVKAFSGAETKEVGKEVDGANIKTKLPDVTHKQKPMRGVMIIDGQDGTYKCMSCDFETKDKVCAKNHVRRLHMPREYQCTMCDASFGMPTDLRKHAFSVHGKNKPKCELCNKEYSSVVALSKHMLVHKEGYVQQKHKCKDCDKCFSSIYTLKYHVKYTHMGMKRPTFLCTYCGATFTQKIHMQEHQNTHTGSRPYQCTVCDKTFSYKASLRIHQHVHSDERNYACKECGARFKTRQSLLMHLDKHKDFRFKCTYCSKQFWQKQSLVRHTRIHLGIRPYQCSLCGNMFGDISILRRHLLLKHKLPQENLPEFMRLARSAPSAETAAATVSALQKIGIMKDPAAAGKQEPTTVVLVTEDGSHTQALAAATEQQQGDGQETIYELHLENVEEILGPDVAAAVVNANLKANAEAVADAAPAAVAEDTVAEPVEDAAKQAEDEGGEEVRIVQAIHQSDDPNATNDGESTTQLTIATPQGETLLVIQGAPHEIDLQKVFQSLNIIMQPDEAPNQKADVTQVQLAETDQQLHIKTEQAQEDGQGDHLYQVQTEQSAVEQSVQGQQQQAQHVQQVVVQNSGAPQEMSVEVQEQHPLYQLQQQEELPEHQEEQHELVVLVQEPSETAEQQ